MAILLFSDILKKVGIDPKNVKLIRHVMSDAGFRACYEADKVYEYTCHQKKDFSKGYTYWITFISDGGKTARLHACYKVGPAKPDLLENAPSGIPNEELVEYKGENEIFELEYVDALKEYENRLTIDWGNSARSWHQKGTTEKEVLGIQFADKERFPGFEELILDYDKLNDLYQNPEKYDTWYAAMSSVKAIYLIVDKENGKQYVGSAYGSNGLWGRWECYAKTYHGGNKLMKEIICACPERYHLFQFSVLQVLSMAMKDSDVIELESVYKKKLQTIRFGMNDN